MGKGYDDFMRGNILIVEDAVELAEVVAKFLTKEGFEVKTVTKAEDAFTLLEIWNCNLIILDINLPGMDGFEFLAKFTKTSNIPVIVISARTAEEDQIIALGIGADEYVIKPFSPRLLTARVRALFRRVNCLSVLENKMNQIYKFGLYTLNMNTRTLKKNNKPIELSAKEYALLAFLVENEGKPMKPETIYEKVWDGSFGDLTTVPVHIQRLRKKIEDDPAKPVWLVTSRGMGYKLNKDAADISQAANES